jgi:outer membrane protein assembly factor BamD
MTPLDLSTRRWARASAPALLCLALVACGSTPKDDTAQWTPERLYAEAKENAASGSYERAGKLYERLEGRAAGTVLAQQAQIERAYSLYRGGEKAQALSVLDRFIKLHPTSAALDYALYLRGLVNFNDNLGILGNFTSQDLSERDQQAAREAYQAFKQLVDQFPDSAYSDDARSRMGYIVNSLAAYEVHVARYYFKRAAYVAAAIGAPAGGAGVPALARDRGGAVHHGPELRGARPARAPRRRRSGAAPQFPEHHPLPRRHRHEAEPVVEALVMRRRAALWAEADAKASSTGVPCASACAVGASRPRRRDLRVR